MKGGVLGPGREFDLIRRFLERNAPLGPEVILGAGDDCALIAAPQVAISVDLTLEGVHFRRDWLTPEEIGSRATVAALSDLAAMAAVPIGVFASLAVASTDIPELATRIMAGVTDTVAGYGGALLGGDLVRSVGGIVLDLVVLGSVVRPVRRVGAEPGDEIWVTGELGGAGAAVGAWLAGSEPEPSARRAYAHPRARIAEARWLEEVGVLQAMLDLSDGLAGDLRHLAAASAVGIVVDEERIPVHPAAAAAGNGLELALGGGEDYELCFAAPAGLVEGIEAEFAERFGTRLHRIGAVLEPGESVGELVIGAGQVALRRIGGGVELLQQSGFEHFSGGGVPGT